MEKLNQNNATIKKADKGQLHCYIKKNTMKKICHKIQRIFYFNPYPANVENMVSSYQC